MKIEKSNLGRVIKDVRCQLGMTQREVAEKTGLTINYLSLLENGKRGIGLDQLNVLAGVFGTPPLLLLSLATQPSGRRDSDADRLLKQIQTITRQAIALYTTRPGSP